MAAAVRVALLLKVRAPVAEALDVALALALLNGVAEPEAGAETVKVADGLGGAVAGALTLALALSVALLATLRVCEACALALPHAVPVAVAAAADGEALPLPLPACEAVKDAEGQAVAVSPTDAWEEAEAAALALKLALSAALPVAGRVCRACALAVAQVEPERVGAPEDGEALPLALPPPPASEAEGLTEGLAVVDALPLLPGLLPEGEPLAENKPDAVRSAVPGAVAERPPLALAALLSLGISEKSGMVGEEDGEALCVVKQLP